MPHDIDWDKRAGPAANARKHLPVLVSRYFQLVRELLGEEPSARKLHRLRLATKRLRYTLELFRPCYGPGFDTRLKELRRIQTLLGEMSDASATARLLAKNGKRSPQRINAETQLRVMSARGALEFAHQWKDVFDAPGRERWWTGYLAREARAPGRAK